MIKGSHVRISKHWQKPAISINVIHPAGTVDVEMPLIDFVKALASEIGNPATLLTNAQLERKLLLASLSVTEKMKAETTSVA